MHKLAKRLLTEVVAPKVEKLLGDGINPVELEHAYKMTCLAKELLEADHLMKKLGMEDPEGHPSYPTKPSSMTQL